MTNWKKRAACLFLSAVMALSVAGAGTAAFAAEADGEGSSSPAETVGGFTNTDTEADQTIVLTGVPADESEAPQDDTEADNGGASSGDKTLSADSTVKAAGEQTFGDFVCSYNASAITNIAADTYTVKQYNGTDTDVTIPKTVGDEDTPVVSVAKEAFAGTSVQTVTLPGTVTHLAQDAFSNCDTLTTVVFTGEAPGTADGAFPNKNGLTIRYPAEYASGYQTLVQSDDFDQIRWEIDGVVDADDITLDRTELKLAVGKSETLTATVTPSYATDSGVTWSSSDPSVATVADGTVTAAKAGTSVITAETSNGLTAICNVTVAVPTLTLSKTAVTVDKGKTYTLKATLDPEDAEDTVSWSSSDPLIATVSNTGVITAIKPGDVIITAETISGKTAACTVTVKSTATAVKLNKTSATVNKGGTLTLTATLTPADSTDAVTWSSSDTTVAAVSSKGVVTAKKAGTATITVKTQSGMTAACKVTVKVPATVVKLNKTSASVEVTKTLALKATLSPTDTTDTVTWSSSNTAVATVSSKGVVTAKKAGTATITAKASGGKTATCKITVLPSVSSIKLSASSVTIERGKTTKLTVKYSPSNSARRSVTWSSSNTSVATVNSSGTITGKKAGTATITAKTPNGKKATCKVKVELVRNYKTTTYLNYRTGPGTGYRVAGTFVKGAVIRIVSGYSKKANGLVWWKVKINGKYYYVAKKYLKNIPVTKVTLSSAASVKMGGTVTLSAKVTPSNATNPDLTWSSSNKTVATVSGGKVTGKKLGVTTITVKTKNGKKATCKVTVKLAPPSGLKGAAKSKSAVQLTWKQVPGASGYYVYRASGNSGTYRKIKTITSGSTTVYTNTCLNVNTSYYYKIKAYHKNSAYNSNFTSVIKANNGQVGFTALGIDVSAWQGKIDWAKVKASGVKFVILRAGYGSELSQKDAYFDYNIQQAKKYNLKVGVYWFSYALTPEAAKKEAQVCYEVIKNYQLDYPVFYDFEYDSVRYANQNGVTITKAKATAFCEAFCQEMISKNRNAGIYTNPDCINKYFEWSTLNKYPLWLAHWDVAKPMYPCDFWQFSDSGSVDGISGRVDMNYW